MEATSLPTTQRLIERFGEAVLDHHAHRGDETVLVRSGAAFDLLRVCKEEPALDFNFLMDLTVVDYLTHPEPQRARFEVVYHLYSLSKNHRLRVKVPVSIGEPVKSAVPLWEAANWWEREAWEMYGVGFEGHPNLKRLMTHVDFVGYPLRKDYPLKKRQPLSESDPLMDEMDKRLREKGLK